MRVGEVVQLKSGGPLMVIERSQEAYTFKLFGYEIERKAYVICEWYDADDTKYYVRDRFLPEQLQTVPSMSNMSFRELNDFEIEATARRINK
jgi:uncharacterized protein YodC (DUF2158 family)